MESAVQLRHLQSAVHAQFTTIRILPRAGNVHHRLLTSKAKMAFASDHSSQSQSMQQDAQSTTGLWMCLAINGMGHGSSFLEVSELWTRQVMQQSMPWGSKLTLLGNDWSLALAKAA